MLRGSDPKLRDQVIIVCAHYDHIGYGGRGLSLDGYGDVHPGADDNASGTSAVLELAQAMTILSAPPKRTILFANWDAEEKGLLGSRHWAAHPTVPLGHVVAGLNLDMVGRLRNDHLIVFASRSGCGWRRLLSSHNQSGLRIDFPWGVKANADQYPLFEHDIPVLLFHTGMHQNYHRASDLAKFINKQGMMEITRMLFGVVYDLANEPTTPAFRAAARHETPEARRGTSRSSREAGRPARRRLDRRCRGRGRGRRVVRGAGLAGRTGRAAPAAIASCGSPAETSAATTISTAPFGRPPVPPRSG